MRTSLSILPLAVILLVQLAAEEFRVDGKTTKKPKPAAIPLRAKREETTTSPEPPPPSSTTEAMKQDEGVVDQEALLKAVDEMGEALVDAFQHMTLNDTAKAEAVESDLKKTFPWMAAVDLDSPENLTETIRERFMQRSSADERDLAEMAADHLITKFSILAKVNQLDRDQYTVLGKALNHLFKWLDEGEEKKEEDKGE